MRLAPDYEFPEIVKCPRCKGMWLPLCKFKNREAENDIPTEDK